ncbi:hypothetical protein P7B02_15210 [Caulobacter segnis]|uniref:hypothetical protein n=1 Tax=Caulobacter segnis TaxID=88688 RepID=UPI00240F7193|nr:hypothetical protein [Caulobacter segnis]MDG2522884.1 hypothetical protein [Caulobacter segnis]
MNTDSNVLMPQEPSHGRSTGMDHSSTYYDHKRASLLASTVLLILSLPGVRMDKIDFGGVEIGGLSADVILWMLLAAAIYYFAQHWLIWRTEASRYSLHLRHDQTDLLAVMKQRVEALDQHGLQIAQASDEIKVAVKRVIARLDAPPSSSLIHHGSDAEMIEEQTLSVIINQIAREASFSDDEIDVLFDVAFENALMASSIPQTTEIKALAQTLKSALTQQHLPAQLRAPLTRHLKQAIRTLERECPHLYLNAGGLREVRRQVLGGMDQTRTELGKATGVLAGLHNAIQIEDRYASLRIRLIDMALPTLLFGAALIAWLCKIPVPFMIGYLARC